MPADRVSRHTDDDSISVKLRELDGGEIARDVRNGYIAS
jgi:hypothetical protein